MLDFELLRAFVAVAECGGPEGGRACTQERPAVEHEHVSSPSFDVWSFENKRRY